VGLLTTREDPGGRATVYDRLDPGLPWLFPVGRLDRDSSGLLILTNDHRLAHRLTDPQHHVPRTYHVRVAGHPEPWALERLRQGLTLTGLRGDVETRPAEVRPLGATRGGESWLEIVLREGRYRQVRRMCGAVGHAVVQLVRVRIGDFALGELPEGEHRRLDEAEVCRLCGEG
jgi:23S rRNA pseudouridine2605 synthase